MVENTLVNEVRAAARAHDAKRLQAAVRAVCRELGWNRAPRSIEDVEKAVDTLQRYSNWALQLLEMGDPVCIEGDEIVLPPYREGGARRVLAHVKVEDGLVRHDGLIRRYGQQEPEPDEPELIWQEDDLEIGHPAAADFLKWRDDWNAYQGGTDQIVYQGPRVFKGRVEKEARNWLRLHKMDVQSIREEELHNWQRQQEESLQPAPAREITPADAWVIYTTLGEDSGYQVEALEPAWA